MCGNLFNLHDLAPTIYYFNYTDGLAPKKVNVKMESKYEY